MPTAEKTAAIEQLQKTLESATAIFLADFTGLDVEKMTELRRKCRENGVHFQVIKNTLAVKATRDLGLAELEPHFRGPTALAVSEGDPTSPARVLYAFRKEHERPELKLGFVEGRILDPEEVKAIATLPTRDQLISQVMQLAQSPARNFVGVLDALLSKLVRTLDAVRDGMEKGTIPAAGVPGAAGAETPAGEGKAGGEAPEADDHDVKSENDDDPPTPKNSLEEPNNGE